MGTRFSTQTLALPSKKFIPHCVIASIEGTLAEANVLSAVLELNGIGYLVNVPLTVSCKLPPIGSPVKLQIYPVYREDRRELYGFLSKEERDFFGLIVEKVAGIGPRTALSVMSKLSLSVLVEAIGSGDAEILAKCHGIGKKTAERITMELSDRNLPKLLRKSMVSAPRVPMDANAADSIAALVSLGYRAADAEKAVAGAIEKVGSGASTESIIRAALGS
jgi:Holliday junction DNA helicase RuvA